MFKTPQKTRTRLSPLQPIRRAVGRKEHYISCHSHPIYVYKNVQCELKTSVVFKMGYFPKKINSISFTNCKAFLPKF